MKCQRFRAINIPADIFIAFRLDGAGSRRVRGICADAKISVVLCLHFVVFIFDMIPGRIIFVVPQKFHLLVQRQPVQIVRNVRNRHRADVPFVKTIHYREKVSNFLGKRNRVVKRFIILRVDAVQYFVKSHQRVVVPAVGNFVVFQFAVDRQIFRRVFLSNLVAVFGIAGRYYRRLVIHQPLKPFVRICHECRIAVVG